MKQTSENRRTSEQVVKGIRRATRKHHATSRLGDKDQADKILRRAWPQLMHTQIISFNCEPK